MSLNKPLCRDFFFFFYIISIMIRKSSLTTPYICQVLTSGGPTKYLVYIFFSLGATAENISECLHLVGKPPGLVVIIGQPH